MITTISKTPITDGKLPRDYEIEEVLLEDKKDTIKVSDELTKMAIQKKGIESAIESYNIHVARIKKAETQGKATADLTVTVSPLTLTIPEVNYNTDPLTYN